LATDGARPSANASASSLAARHEAVDGVDGFSYIALGKA